VERLMTAGRFQMPAADASTPVRFPDVVRDTLDNGLTIRVIPQDTVPVVTLALVIQRGTSDDPAEHHGLASLTGDLLDEGAGSRDAIEVAEAFGRLGAELDVDVGPDATSLSVTALSRHLDAVLDLVADVVSRPRLEVPDFQRVRELRTSRLRQLSRLPGAAADRAIASAVFAEHPYGHGSLGTTAALAALTVDDARAFWASMYSPAEAALVAAGAIDADQIRRSIDRAFSGWSGPAPQRFASPPVAVANPRLLVVDRPGAPQCEVRVGHAGPSRRTETYHALVTLNALVGGQFTSRINRRLREEKGVTYGARSAFDFRRTAGLFSCETSVQADRVTEAVEDVLTELEDVRHDGAVAADELDRAKASLTRGYVRSFETATQLVRAAALLVTYGLDEGTFDRFVPSVESLTAADIETAARTFLRPADATVVVVGDASLCRASLERIGRPIQAVSPEF
jgi:predicted Zn-dependent peptidase